MYVSIVVPILISPTLYAHNYVVHYATPGKGTVLALYELWSFNNGYKRSKILAFHAECVANINHFAFTRILEFFNEAESLVVIKEA